MCLLMLIFLELLPFQSRFCLHTFVVADKAHSIFYSVLLYNYVVFLFTLNCPFYTLTFISL